MGATPYDGPVTKFSETPAQLRKAAPALGEDTDLVLRELLGLTGDRSCPSQTHLPGRSGLLAVLKSCCVIGCVCVLRMWGL